MNHAEVFPVFVDPAFAQKEHLFSLAIASMVIAHSFSAIWQLLGSISYVSVACDESTKSLDGR